MPCSYSATVAPSEGLDNGLAVNVQRAAVNESCEWAEETANAESDERCRTARVARILWNDAVGVGLTMVTQTTHVLLPRQAQCLLTHALAS